MGADQEKSYNNLINQIEKRIKIQLQQLLIDDIEYQNCLNESNKNQEALIEQDKNLQFLFEQKNKEKAKAERKWEEARSLIKEEYSTKIDELHEIKNRLLAEKRAMGGYTRYTYDYYQDLKRRISKCFEYIDDFKRQRTRAYEKLKEEAWNDYDNFKTRVSNVKATLGNLRERNLAITSKLRSLMRKLKEKAKQVILFEEYEKQSSSSNSDIFYDLEDLPPPPTHFDFIEGVKETDVNLTLKVQIIPNQPELDYYYFMDQEGVVHRVKNILIGDPSGIITLSLYDDEIGLTADTSGLLLTRVKSRTYQGSIILRLSQRSICYPIEETFPVNYEVFISKKGISSFDQFIKKQKNNQQLLAAQRRERIQNLLKNTEKRHNEITKRFETLKKQFFSDLLKQEEIRKRARRLFNDGMEFYENKLYELALVRFQETTSLNPEHMLGWYYQLEVYNFLGKRNEVMQAYNKALEYLPEFSDALNIVCQEKEIERSLITESYLNNSFKSGETKKLVQNLNFKCNKFFKQQNYLKALVYVEKALELKSTLPHLWYNKGLLLCYQQNFSDAEKCFINALKLAPNYSRAAKSLEKVLFEVERLRQEQEFKEAVEAGIIFAEDSEAYFDNDLEINYWALNNESLDLEPPKPVLWVEILYPHLTIEEIGTQDFTSALRKNRIPLESLIKIYRSDIDTFGPYNKNELDQNISSSGISLVFPEGSKIADNYIVPRIGLLSSQIELLDIFQKTYFENEIDKKFFEVKPKITENAYSASKETIITYDRIVFIRTQTFNQKLRNLGVTWDQVECEFLTGNVLISDQDVAGQNLVFNLLSLQKQIKAISKDRKANALTSYFTLVWISDVEHFISQNNYRLVKFEKIDLLEERSDAKMSLEVIRELFDPNQFLISSTISEKAKFETFLGALKKSIKMAIDYVERQEAIKINYDKFTVEAYGTVKLVSTEAFKIDDILTPKALVSIYPSSTSDEDLLELETDQERVVKASDELEIVNEIEEKVTSKESIIRDEAIIGTVLNVQKNKVTIKLANSKQLNKIPSTGFVTESSSSYPFLVQQDLIKNIQNYPDLIEILRLLTGASQLSPSKEVDFKPISTKNFTNTQELAVKRALGNNKLTFIQGPPGTGKTTVIVEIILQMLERGKRILVTSTTNVAVDNALEKLLKFKQKGIVRVGSRCYSEAIKPYLLPRKSSEMRKRIREKTNNILLTHKSRNVNGTHTLSQLNKLVIKIPPLIQIRADRDELYKLITNPFLETISELSDERTRINAQTTKTETVVEECKREISKIEDFLSEQGILNKLKRVFLGKRKKIQLETFLAKKDEHIRKIEQFNLKDMDLNKKIELEEEKTKEALVTHPKYNEVLKNWDNLARIYQDITNDSIFRIFQDDIFAQEEKKLTFPSVEEVELSFNQDIIKRLPEMLWQTKRSEIIVYSVQEWLQTLNADPHALDKIILSNSQVVGATCIGSGHWIFNDQFFDVVLLDEASKSTISETLVPLKLANQYILIGDHKQLPPTVPHIDNPKAPSLLVSKQDKDYVLNWLKERGLFRSSLMIKWYKQLVIIPLWQSLNENQLVSLEEELKNKSSSNRKIILHPLKRGAIVKKPTNTIEIRGVNQVGTGVEQNVLKFYRTDVEFDFQKVLLNEDRALDLVLTHSFFEIFAKIKEAETQSFNGVPIIPNSAYSFLNKQFRMPPALGKLVSDIFYETNLKNGKTTQRSPYPGFKIINFINIEGIKGRDKGFERIDGAGAHKSYKNPIEAEICIILLKKLLTQQDSDIKSQEIGIITPYSAQTDLIDKKIKKWSSLTTDFDDNTSSNWTGVDVKTVDAYQGKEKKVIIYSFTRSNQDAKGLARVGHVKDEKRLNVSLSRCSEILFLIGDRLTLERTRDRKGRALFKELLDYLDKNDEVCYINNPTGLGDLK